MISEALYAHLAADPAVSAIVGDRIYPAQAPQTAAYPLIQYTQVAGQRFPVLSGLHSTKGPLMQLDLYASQDAGVSGHWQAAKRLAAAVEAAMEHFVGLHGDVEVVGCSLENERELQDVDGTLGRVSQDYQIWWRTT